MTFFEHGFAFYNRPQGIPGIVFWEGWLLYATSFLLAIMLGYSWFQCRKHARPFGASAHYWNWAVAAWAGFFLFALMTPHAAFSAIG